MIRAGLLQNRICSKLKGKADRVIAANWVSLAIYIICSQCVKQCYPEPTASAIWPKESLSPKTQWVRSNLTILRWIVIRVRGIIGLFTRATNVIRHVSIWALLLLVHTLNLLLLVLYKCYLLLIKLGLLLLGLQLLLIRTNLNQLCAAQDICHYIQPTWYS